MTDRIEGHVRLALDDAEGIGIGFAMTEEDQMSFVT
jgi:hypothetical protein